MMILKAKTNSQTIKWDTSEFPMVCEKCLSDNPYIRMSKAEYDLECKICLRPFTVFRWRSATEKFKRTEICLTCAKVKNLCQSCLLDLRFGISMELRDKYLKEKVEIPKDQINRDYWSYKMSQKVDNLKLPYYDDSKYTILDRFLKDKNNTNNTNNNTINISNSSNNNAFSISPNTFSSGQVANYTAFNNTDLQLKELKNDHEKDHSSLEKNEKFTGGVLNPQIELISKLKSRLIHKDNLSSIITIDDYIEREVCDLKQNDLNVFNENLTKTLGSKEINTNDLINNNNNNNNSLSKTYNKKSKKYRKKNLKQNEEKEDEKEQTIPFKTSDVDTDYKYILSLLK